MFTGIIEELGSVDRIESLTNPSGIQLTISCRKILSDIHVGDSIAVNGVCLTAKAFNQKSFVVDVMNETIHHTSLKNLTKGDSVNLERSLALNGRLGGHLVSGHIDGIGEIVAIKDDGIAKWYTIETLPSILGNIVPKGSIAVDGVSLTVAGIRNSQFQVSIIPQTFWHTIFKKYQTNQMVNLENDLIGKYVMNYIPKRK